jgi:methyl-accepting chemotaxis protein
MEARMSDAPRFRRKKHFIKKGFQFSFSIKFVALIAAEAVLLAGLLWYLSLNTLTASYQGSQLSIENTSNFFFTSMLYPGLIVMGVVGIIGIIGLVFISHRIAGPLYRFEKSLTAIGEGDLTYRFNLRRQDQLSDLANTLNSFTSEFENKVAGMKLNIDEITATIREIEHSLASGDNNIRLLIQKLSLSLNSLNDTVSRFKTSQNLQGHDSKGREA